MVAIDITTLRAGERLSHMEATRLAQLAENCGSQTIVLDVSRCLEATTPALARLVLLRRELLASGRDFRIGGLRGQPAKLIEVHRLENVLPCIKDLSRSKPISSYCPHTDVSAGEVPAEFQYADNAGMLCLQ